MKTLAAVLAMLTLGWTSGGNATVATSIAIPTAPENLTARERAGGKIRLDWVDTSDNEDGFELQRRQGTDPWVLRGWLGRDDDRFVDTDPILPACYRVRAYNADGQSAFAGPACVEEEPITCAETETSASFKGFTGDPGTLVADPAIAAGPDRLVVISNQGVTIRCKNGRNATTKGLHEFFGNLMAEGEGSAGDVAAIFDVRSRRFFISEAAQTYPQPECKAGTCIGHTMLAVSKTATPETLGDRDWFFYAFDRYLDRVSGGAEPTANGGDFDKLATDDRVLIITSRLARESDGVLTHRKIRILDKAKLVSGEMPETWVDILSAQDLAGITPATIFGDAPAFFLVSRGRALCGVTVWGLNTKRARPKAITRSVLLDGDCGTPLNGPQKTGLPVDIEGSGFGTLPVYRGGSLWIADTWQKDFGSGQVAVIKWAELDVRQWPNTVRVVQQGTIGKAGVWSFLPSLTVDKEGSLTIAFYTTGPRIYPSLNLAARHASDPQGSMRDTIVLKRGTGPVRHIFRDGRNRFADFSDMALDPSGSMSWVHGQYGKAGRWRSWIAGIPTIGSERIPPAANSEGRR